MNQAQRLKIIEARADDLLRERSQISAHLAAQEAKLVELRERTAARLAELDDEIEQTKQAFDAELASEGD